MRGSALFSRNAEASVTLPTLPQNIKNIMMTLLSGAKERVIPVDMPTVPIAENVSNRTSGSGSFCTAVINTEAITISAKLNVITPDAFFTAFSLSVRPKICVLFFARRSVNRNSNTTASVVVLMPPSLEPVDPPTRIRKQDRSTDGADSSDSETVLNHAVRQVTD